jgi:hypothetical protein
VTCRTALAPACFRDRLHLPPTAAANVMPFAWCRDGGVIGVHDPAGSLLNAAGVIDRLRGEAELGATDRVLYSDGTRRWDEILHDGAHFCGVIILRGRTLAEALAIANGATPREPDHG